MQVHLQTLGCRLNEAETENWARAFVDSGYQLSTDADNADVIIINTCAVTNEAVKKSRKLARRAQRNNPNAKLVISGCYASLPDSPAAELDVDLLIPNDKKDKLVDIVKQELFPKTTSIISQQHPADALMFRGKQRAFIKVQDGCRYRCTFCIVTIARGNEKSRQIADIVTEINRLHQEGIQEVVLTGVHLGGFGSDTDDSLYHLVEAVLLQTDIPRLRLGSLEPWDIPSNFWYLFENPRFMPHLHLPLQSGSDSVLRRMARRCKTTEYSALLEEIRQQYPLFNITTDIIVGFPGETDEEWLNSVKTIETLGFGHIHIFSYSAREGTKAAGLANQIPRDTQKNRSEELHALARQLKQEAMQKNIGQTVEILTEETSLNNGENHYVNSGYTQNFFRSVTINASINEIKRLQLTGISDNGEFFISQEIPE